MGTQHVLNSTKELAVGLLLVALVFLVGFSQMLFFSSWTLALVALVIFYSICMVKKIGLTPALVFGVYLLQCVYTYEVVAGHMNAIDKMAFRDVSAARMVQVLLITTPLLVLKKKYLRAVGVGFLFFGLTSAMVSLSQPLFGLAPTGLLSNISMNACLLAILFSLAPLPEALVLALAVVLSGSSMGMGILAVMAVVRGFSWKYWPVVLIGGVAALFCWAYFYSSYLTFLVDTNGRSSIWLETWHWFLKHGNILWGMGVNTVRIYVPHIQSTQTPWVRDYYIFLHNDWFQILFENGAVFLVLCVSGYLGVLWKAFTKSKAMGGAVLGYGLMMCGNFPMEIAFHSFFGMWLLAYVDISKGRLWTKNLMQR